ncbi:MAG: LysM peptidoglycan-binding domain-containing protein, partial [Planctomycetota bacterium]
AETATSPSFPETPPVVAAADPPVTDQPAFKAADPFAAAAPAEPATIAMNDPATGDAPATADPFDFGAAESVEAAATDPAPIEIDWNEPEPTTPAAEPFDDDAFPAETLAAADPRTPLESEPAAIEDGALWDLSEPTTPAPAELAGTPAPAAADPFFSDEPPAVTPAVTTPEPAEPIFAETTPPAPLDPFGAPAPAMTEPGAGEPGFDVANTAPPVEAPTSPAMTEWPDMNSPPTSNPTAVPPVELAETPPATISPETTPPAATAETTPSGVAPAGFAPETTGALAGPTDARPIRTADGEAARPFRFSGPKDRKVAEVQPGESYWAISKRAYGAAKYFKALARYNALRIRDPRNLQPGMKVICPPPSVLLAYDTDLADAERAAQSRGPKPGWSGFATDDRGRPVYMVGEGDTLGHIAQKHLGKASRAEQIYSLNRDKIRDPSRLRPGSLLNLPADATQMRRRVGEATR